MLKNHLAFFSRMICGLIAGLLLWTGCYAERSEPRPFKPGSLSEIIGDRQGQPFLLILRSVDCPPCRKELDLLAQTRRAHPELDLVLIATDDITSYAQEVHAILKKHGLGDAESWIFADPNAQRLRYEIDPKWYGELPRGYFYDAAHHRLGVSGALKPEHLSAWLADLRS
jgi:hypothetical protein